jgi:single-strand DNA-binding protein
MSEGVNRVFILGNLGADPELRFTQGGTGVLNMRVATTESYLDQGKQRREHTEWHTVVVWGKRGEGLATFLKKGHGVLIEGSIRQSSYDDKDGIKRYKFEIYANNVVVTRGDQNGQRSGQTQHRETRADDRGQGQRSGYGAPRQQQTPQPANDAPPEDFGYDDGETPF